MRMELRRNDVAVAMQQIQQNTPTLHQAIVDALGEGRTAADIASLDFHWVYHVNPPGFGGRQYEVIFDRSAKVWLKFTNNVKKDVAIEANQIPNFLRAQADTTERQYLQEVARRQRNPPNMRQMREMAQRHRYMGPGEQYDFFDGPAPQDPQYNLDQYEWDDEDDGNENNDVNDAEGPVTDHEVEQVERMINNWMAEELSDEAWQVLLANIEEDNAMRQELRVFIVQQIGFRRNPPIPLQAPQAPVAREAPAQPDVKKSALDFLRKR